MTEVHRYKVVKMLSEAGNRIGYDPHGPDVVMADAYDQLKAENERLTNVVGDLSILTKRFVHRLRKAAPDNDLPEQALDYLKRKGLQGRPMRAEDVGHD